MKIFKKIIGLMIVMILTLGISSPTFSQVKQREISVILPSNVFFQDKILFIFVKNIDFGDLIEMFNQMRVISYDKVVIDLFSFGGSVFDALAMSALIEDQQRAGKIVEIRARGIVASAGLIIMMTGTPGYRYIDRLSWVMFHEMQSFKFFAVESVSDQEEQAKINRKIQDKINQFVTAKTKLTPDKLSELIKKKELWCDANEAIAYGFADKVTGSEESNPAFPSVNKR